MVFRTAKLSSFENYLAATDQSLDDRCEQQEDRKGNLERFPFAVMLELAYPELDFAKQWCWQTLGPFRGECFECRSGSKPSEYPTCDNPLPRSHLGKWCYDWFVKTDYDYGFCEWYFSSENDYVSFLAFVPSINWGEKYPD